MHDPRFNVMHKDEELSRVTRSSDGQMLFLANRILATVSRKLTVEFGQAFTLRSLYRAIQFCQSFTGLEIVSTLSTQLSWSHFIELLPIKDPLARDFYAEMCRIKRWDVRTLRQKIGGMLFERTALSKKPESVINSELVQLRDGQTQFMTAQGMAVQATMPHHPRLRSASFGPRAQPTTPAAVV